MSHVKEVIEVSPTEVPSSPSTSSIASPDHDEIPAAERKAIYRKVDLHIIPWLVVCYFFLKTDNGNLTISGVLNAESKHGLQTFLHTSATQWSWALSTFFYTNGFFEPLSNLLIKRMSPKIWQGRIIITWGIITMATAGIKNYNGLIAVRFFLGMAQAGFVPGFVYHLSFWYHAVEMQNRMNTLIYVAFPLSSAFSGLIGYAMSFLDGHQNLFGWQWLFIIEGIPAIVLGLLVTFFLPNYPATSKWLSKSEKDHIISRLPKSQPDYKDPPFQAREIKRLFMEGSFWAFTFLWTLHGVAGYGVQVVLPTVIHSLGFLTTKKSLLMTIPPNILGILLIFTTGYLIRYQRWNSYYIMAFCEAFIALMYLLLVVVSNAYAKYVFLMLGIACSTTLWPILWPLRVQTLRGTTAAAFALGWGNGWSQLAGVIGPHLYNAKYGPTYRISFGICLGLMVLASVMALAAQWFSKREALAWERLENAHAHEVNSNVTIEKEV